MRASSALALAGMVVGPLLIVSGPLIGFSYYKLRHRLTGALPPWDPTSRHPSRSLWLRILLVVAPWLVLPGLLMPFTVMQEPGDPWFLPYTSGWFLFTLLVFMPANWLSNMLGAPPLGVVFWLLCVAWGALMSGTAWFLLLRRRAESGFA